MLFSSLTFLFVFLPILFAAYFIAPKKLKNPILLLFSLLFYAWGGVSYTVILLLSIGVNHLVSGRLSNSNKGRKLWFGVGIGFNVSMILVFKYLDFFAENVNDLLELGGISHQLELPNIQLPLGISFFTFQGMSLLFDVYRSGKTDRSKLSDTALYISLFPQLIAGPIIRYHHIAEQIRNRTSTILDINYGCKRFVYGLFKKVFFANTFAVIADSIMELDLNLMSSGTAWVGIIAYTLQIYFDFSGYSDMAIGLGRIFGFRIPENFNFPYVAKSLREFWKRWHISLTTWFRDYLYIPLGGNRTGNVGTYRNLFIVFLITGFWHGATWSFVIWGMFHGVFLALERIGFGVVLKKLPGFVKWAYTMLVVMFGWVFFRIEEFSDAIIYSKKMLFINSFEWDSYLQYLDKEKLAILCLGIMASTPLFKLLGAYLKPKLGSKPGELLGSIGYILMFLYVIMILSAGTYNPFIYFRF